MIYNQLSRSSEHIASKVIIISHSDIVQNDLSHITMELWELLVFLTCEWRKNFTIKIINRTTFWRNHFLPFSLWVPGVKDRQTDTFI